MSTDKCIFKKVTELVKSLHGSQVKVISYEGRRKKMTVLCPERGEWTCIASHVLKKDSSWPKSTKWTLEKAEKRVKELHGKDVKVLHFENVNKQMIMSCPDRGEWKTIASNVLSKKAMRWPSRKKHNWTIENVTKRIKENYGEGVEVLEYHGYKKHMVLVHPEYGSWKVFAKRVLSDPPSPWPQLKRWTREAANQVIKEKFGQEVEITEYHDDADQPMILVCPHRGEWKITRAYEVLRPDRVFEWPLQTRWDLDNAKEWVKNKYGPEVEILSYGGSLSTKIILNCPQRGEWSTYGVHVLGNGSIEWPSFTRWTYDEAEKAVAKLHGSDVEILQFVNSSQEMIVKCPERGIWRSKGFDILAGRPWPTFDYGFDSNSPARFYIISIGELTKIGITNRTIKDRYQSEGVQYEVLLDLLFDSGFNAVTLESEIKSALEGLGWDEYQLFNYTKNTEVFLIPDELKEVIISIANDFYENNSDRDILEVFQGRQ